MENPGTLIRKSKSKISVLISIVILMFLSLNVLSQGINGQNPDPRSQSEQSSSYLQNLEQDPNGVPNSSAWYAQPWIWAIVAAILILLIAMFTRSKDKEGVEPDSENGVG